MHRLVFQTQAGTTKTARFRRQACRERQCLTFKIPINSTQRGPSIQHGFNSNWLQRKTNLEYLKSKQVIALLDVENLYFSARDHDRVPNWRRMVEWMNENTRRPQIHVFFARHKSDAEIDGKFREIGCIPHPTLIEKSWAGGQRKTHANSDACLLFTAGNCVSRSSANVVLVGSGDGELVSRLASCVTDLNADREVVTMSIPGSTSQRIKATRCQDIASNVMLGRDLLLSKSEGSQRLYGVS